MRYTCPKCGKHIELSAETLIAAEYKTVCPQCLTALEIVGDYAYVPLDDGTLELRHADSQPDAADVAATADVTVGSPTPPPLPSQLAPGGTDPLLDEAVRFLAQCSAITPMMLRDHFGITLERAQDLIAQLERAGCIGPYRGGAPRQILIEHRQGLPSPFRQPRHEPGQPTDGDDREQPRGKLVSVNCGSCLIWMVILAAVMFLIL